MFLMGAARSLTHKNNLPGELQSPAQESMDSLKTPILKFPKPDRSTNPLADLQKAAQSGNSDKIATAFSAVESIFSRHIKSVIANVARTNRSEHDDLLQEVYIKILKGVLKYDTDKDPYAWLASVTANCVTDCFRKKQHRLTKALSLDNDSFAESGVNHANLVASRESDLHGIHAAIRSEEIAIVRSAINKLPKEKRTLLQAQHSGSTYAELAHEHDVPLGTLKSRMNTAKIELGEQINKILYRSKI